jgi:hypothetical protein
MANSVEIDRPLPGDTLGLVVEVGGTYSLEGRFDGVFTIRVKFLQGDGDLALKADGVTPVPDVSTGLLASGDNQPWSVTFNLDAAYDDHQFQADLLSGADVQDTDVVIDMGVRVAANAIILVNTLP